jgi:hypothetical protein
MLELIVPEPLKNLVTAKPLTRPRDRVTPNWTVTTRSDSRLLGIRQLTARAATPRNGHPVVSETTFEVEFVGGPTQITSR